LNFRDVIDVRTICETGSMRKAAEVLGITQPTLSTRIAHLEDQLGAPLFDRTHGRSQPTDLALFIARRAKVMADEADRLSGEVLRLSSGKDGLVRIGLGPAITRVLVGRLAAAVKDRSPDISLELVSGPAHQLGEALLRRELDVLVCEPLDVAHGAVAVEQMFESEMVAVARPDHPLCAAPPADLTGFLSYPIATSHVRQTMLEVLRRDHGIDLGALPGRVVCSDLEMVVRVVAASPMLFAVGPRSAYAPEIACGALAIIGTTFPFKHTVCLHTNSDAHPLPAVGKVRELIRELLAAMRTDAT